ncbi:MAG: hypothetical protein A3J47_04355 [Candidatus Yanofskybacteria bacterium RIFCSPHIGHO2_02_FULL_43_22]|uniref:Uncharacterized protein n=1 Tax=Candidatus Yanofskybacteria bacterium RIFCSPHIGHO2_02_FULL_43_22 TaxID=1802681 RepID=A0A1F8FLK6_9BACT|nr:MAG: hypothetical protein A3J47_04355 [Candidatus Yanofskybacteria bacterium RIFCSPHIGHO2_02_FULL_43_22]
MFILNIFSRMHRSIKHKVASQEPGLYLSLIFPVAVAFLLTFSVARTISYFVPAWGIFIGDFRIHHFTWGIFVLAVSGYLALVFSTPEAKYLISLLHGFGLGLAFDEFAFWLKLTDDVPARWSYDGFLIVAGFIFLIISAKPGVKMLKKLWPFHP